MVGTISARTLDYFGLLVAASIVALCSGVLATLCVKYEFSFLRGSLRHPSLVLHWSVRIAWGSCCEERNLYLPRSSRATLQKMNPSLKRGIMQVQTLVCSRSA
jgi:hypothetical protein